MVTTAGRAVARYPLFCIVRSQDRLMTDITHNEHSVVSSPDRVSVRQIFLWPTTIHFLMRHAQSARLDRWRH